MIENDNNNPLIGALSKGDFWNDLPEELKYDINQAKDELNKGEGISHLRVIAELKTRFLNK